MENYATDGQCIQNWYCARTIAGRERVLNEALLGLNIETYLPIEIKTSYRMVTRLIPATGQYVPVEEPVKTEQAYFRGYLFARLGDYEWAQAKTRLGVHLRPRWVDFGLGPVGLSQEDVSYLQEMVDAANQRPVRPVIQAGQPVKVLRGPYAGLPAVFSRQLNGAERVEVLMTFLGALRPIEMGRTDIQIQTGWTS